MKPICLLLAVVVLSNAQKSHRAGPHGHGGEGKSSGSYSEPPSHKQYSHGGSGGNHYQQPAGAYTGQSAAKTYPLILSDNRQLNHDGTINFNYAADNGLQQGETVDPDGTRRGFYSYIGADGKPLTVKYTAGKNGFVAEGDHLPRQPNIAAQTKDEVVTKAHGGHYQGGPSSGSYQGGPSSENYYGGAPSHYSANAHSHGGQSPYNGGGGSHYNGGGGSRNHYNSPPPPSYHGGSRSPSSSNFGFSSGGPSSSPYSSGPSHGGHYQSSPQTQYSHSLPSHGGGFSGGRGHSSMHSAFNPYTPVGPAGPYQGAFDLGNGGQFSINFEPGQAQEVSYGGGNPGGHSHHGGAQQQRY